VRRELAVRTIFNLLGPLTNPAGARRQLIGVSDPSFLETIAGALASLGVDRALIVASEDGLDEISSRAPTEVVEVNGEEIRRFTLEPGDVGITPASNSELERAMQGGTPAHNAAVTRAILDGEAGFGADLAVINAGAAIYAAGRAETIAVGVEMARTALEDGSAAGALERYLEVSRGQEPAVLK
jgi:anthranilate phosphoribosyltransferase